MRIVENTPELLVLEHVTWALLVTTLGFMSVWIVVAVAFVFAGQSMGALITLGLGTVLPAGLIWGFMARSQLVFDKGAGTLEHRRRGFRGFRKQQFALDDIERVYVGQKGPKQGQLFFYISGGIDAGHHAFPRNPDTLKQVLEANDIVKNWLGT